ncbi:MAG: hypothetical protein ACI4AH_06110 [Muribaculaceae bacterium]
MKLIKNHLIALLAVFSLAFVNTSCFNDDDDSEDVDYYVEFVTVNASSDGLGWFESAGGRYYPSGLPSTIDLSKYIGNRAYITYSISDNVMPGFDKVINLVALNIAITEYGVRYVSTAEELEELGSEPISVEKNNTHLKGNWLDLIITYYYDSDVSTKFSLAAPDPSLLPEGLIIPDGYLYLELHQKSETEFLMVNRVQSLVSFNLDDAHNPEIQGYKGIYLKVENGSLNPVYLTIDNVVE